MKKTNQNLNTVAQEKSWSMPESIFWRSEWRPTPVFLPGEAHGQRSLVGYIVHEVAKSCT